MPCHRVTGEAALAYLEANGMSPAPTFFHQQIVQNLLLALLVVTAPVDVVLAGLVQHGRLVGASDLGAEAASGVLGVTFTIPDLFA